ncbi:MucB/RseB C-terminal domain-containing protein [Alloalcanivorax xenomutans]|uniref:MucB/RseB C-terminal domain-containing protein n=1 Tax=Alloalcanivorax xenomutans TaxID=1094342 RepID=UPI0035A8A53D
MLRTLAFGLTLIAPLPALLLAPPASAQEAPAATLLQSMSEASRQLNYKGRFLYQFGAEVSTMEVSHAVFDDHQYQRLTHLDGRLVEVLRRGPELVCLHSNGTLTRISDANGLPLEFQDRLASAIPSQYNVLLDGDGRVAGRPTLRVRVAPLDNHRYGYRLWLDDESKLLLKSEMVDGNGLALERVEFVTLDLNPGLQRIDFDVPETHSERALENVASSRPGNFVIEAQWLPGGFEAVDRDWRRVDTVADPVAAQSYSDGLATFTVFAEATDGASPEEGVSRVGPTVAISRHIQNGPITFLMTLVGEIPQPTAERVMQSIQVSTAQ